MQIALVVNNYLPETMFLDQLEFITEGNLFTRPDTIHSIPSRTTKRLLIDCIPKEADQIRIQGFSKQLFENYRLMLLFI